MLTPPITQAFQCSNEQAARVATVFLITMTLAMPAAGWLLDRIAPCPVMTAGAVLTVIGYFVAARSLDIDVFTVAMGIAGIGVGASTYVPAITLASHWIAPHRQGLAYGILLAGGAIGAIIFPVLITHLTNAFGWRYAMQSIGWCIALTCVPLLLWVARLPNAEEVTHVAAPGMTPLAGYGIGEALRMPRYWLWIVMMLLVTLSSLGVYIALVPYLVASGYSAERAAAIYAAVGAATFIGNFLFGALSERWGARAVLLVGTAASAAGILCLLAVRDRTLGMMAIASFSLIWGSTFNLANQLSPLLLAEAVGQRNFGSLLGIGNLISGLGSAISPEALGYLVDVTHTYTHALVLCTALMAAALVPIALMRGAPREGIA
ncbi:MFS transporter [Ralstonia sp. 21MJYT02-11]|uniref:MFS transporter n=1 Tax=Ralstonia soli TaxID=2953896 RepID=A0ABT1AG02_9RALS|nr:MFS transporter [Ralstonia soli]